MSPLTFLPDEAIPALMVIVGLIMILQPRMVASFTFYGSILFSLMLIRPFFMMLPEWALSAVVIFLWGSMSFTRLYLLMGRDASAKMVGTVTADIVRYVFLVPVRILSQLIRKIKN